LLPTQACVGYSNLPRSIELKKYATSDVIISTQLPRIRVRIRFMGKGPLSIAPAGGHAFAALTMSAGIEWLVLEMIKYTACVVLLMLSALVAGCAPSYGPVAQADSAGPIARYDGPLPAADSPRMQPGDKIKVTVYGEDNLNGIYEIDPSGSVSLPLAGTVMAAGRTKAELQRDIARRYKSEYLQDPKVTVDFASFRPIYILGEAEKPGEYPYKSGLNLISAVTAAGGFTYRASRDHVMIQHSGEEMWKEYPLSTSVAIAPGDLIRIPERYF
jgi:protein involved in polysaccharide export with SLBB domain